MSASNIAIIAVRLVALYCVVRSIEHLSHVVLFFTSNIDASVPVLAAVFLPIAIWLLGALATWFSAPWLASWILPIKSSDNLGQFSISLEELYGLAFCIVGLLAVFGAVGPITQALNITVSYALIDDETLKLPEQFIFERRAHIITAVVKMALGIWLIAGKSSLTRLILRLRAC